MTPYEIFHAKPFPRRRSVIERICGSIGLNRWFLRLGNPPHFRLKDNQLASPAESRLCEIQTLRQSMPVRGKATAIHKEWYSYEELTYSSNNQSDFEGGLGFNFYLNPLNLHYTLFPWDLKVTAIDYHPHFCWPLLFMKSGEVKNERVVIHAETTHGIPIVIVMIGSFLVAGIECIAEVGKTDKRSDIMGGFKFGSTAMVLFPKDTVKPLVEADTKLSLGEPFAEFL